MKDTIILGKIIHLSIDEILDGLQNSSRFSREVLDFFTTVIIKYSDHYNDQIKFWIKISNSLMNAKEYSRKTNKLDVMELTELTAWTKNMASMAKNSFSKSSKLSGNSGLLRQAFVDFINGETSYMSKCLRCQYLSKTHQQMFSKEVNSLIIKKMDIKGIFTQINHILHSYLSVILKSDSITFIVSSEESNIKSHIHNVSRLVNRNFNVVYSNRVSFILDLIIESDPYILKKIFYYLKSIEKINRIDAFIIDDLGGIISHKLPDFLLRDIINSIDSFDRFNTETFQQMLKSNFASERTFIFADTSGATWVRQVRKANELLEFFLALEKILIKYKFYPSSRNREVIFRIKNIIRKSFNDWETLKKHSSNPEFISNLHIDSWICCLKSVSKDELGYLLNFDFDEIKGKIKDGNLRKAKGSFFDRFRILRHGTFGSDRWNGVIYDNIGKYEKHSDKSNRYIFRIRYNIELWKSIFEKRILKDLEDIALSDLKRLNKYFKNESLQFLKEIWVNNGYETPDKFLKSFTNDQNNPLNILKKSTVTFRVINAIDILCKENIKEKPSYSFDFFKELYINSKLIKRACRAKNIIETNIKRGEAFGYLNKRTKNDVSIPRYSKSKGVVFPDITNENEKAAAIRVFLDLITNSNEGRKLLVELGFLSEKNLLALSAKDASIVIDWKKGLKGFSIENQIAGLPDGLVVVKKGSKYYNEFFVEMIGLSKGKQAKANLETQSPYSSIIGDLLRVACNGAAGKPGIVVYGQINKNGDVIYTIIKFDEQSISRLREAGAHFAVDLNRPKVRKLLINENYDIKNSLNNVFYEASTLNLNTDLKKFLLKSSTALDLYRLFFILIKIMLDIGEIN